MFALLMLTRKILQDYCRVPMTKQTPPKRAVTPPKGKPTRSRHDIRTNRRVFGPVSQWIAITVLLILAFVVLIILTGGGDFNPLNNQSGQVGTVAAMIGATLTAMF